MGPHAGRALQDRGLERRLAALIDVLDGEVPLHRLDALHGVRGVAAALGSAAVDDARLVEVDVRLDETRRQQPTAEVELLAPIRSNPRCDLGDLSVANADVPWPLHAMAPQRCTAQHEIHSIFHASARWSDQFYGAPAAFESTDGERLRPPGRRHGLRAPRAEVARSSVLGLNVSCYQRRQRGSDRAGSALWESGMAKGRR